MFRLFKEEDERNTVSEKHFIPVTEIIFEVQSDVIFIRKMR